MALMISKGGCVIGIDRVPQLIENAIKSVQKDKPGYIDIGRIKLIGNDSS